MTQKAVSTHKRRTKGIAAAIGSVRAAGLIPTQTTIDNLHRYANDELSAQALRRATIKHVQYLINKKQEQS